MLFHLQVGKDSHGFFDVCFHGFLCCVDDIGEEEIPWGNYVLKGISDSDAEAVVKFVEKNKDKNFMIHCKAGQSRSQAIIRYVLDFYGGEDEWEINKDNPPITPNQFVLSKLKRSYYNILTK